MSAPGVPAPVVTPSDLDLTDLDARRSPRLRSELPHLESAFDRDGLREPLRAALLDPADDRELDVGPAGKALYLGDEGCTLRYQVDVLDRGKGTARHVMTARVFGAEGVAEEFLRRRLEPLVAGARPRPRPAGLRTPVAVLRGMRTAVHVFPVDPVLPTLVGATDPRTVAEHLSESLGTRVAPDGLRAEVAHYPRRGRCVLRYEMTGGDPGTTVPRVVYGKTYGEGPLPSVAAVEDLRRRAEAIPDGLPLMVPRPVGQIPGLRLNLFEAVPALPRMARMIDERTRDVVTEVDAPTLEEAVEACGQVAARLHACPIEGVPERTIRGELAALHRDLATVDRLSPRLGGRLRRAIEQVESMAGRTPAQPPGFCHGDFTASQLLFDWPRVALVDFDNLCLAEPAIDLGQFLAYLRVAIEKAQRKATTPREGQGDRLAARFLGAYAEGRPDAEPRHLKARMDVYEHISLIRMAVHSWHQLKPERVARALAVLEERSA